MEQEKTLRAEDILRIAWRRRWGFMISLPVVFLISVVVVLIWKPVYRSTATILIEEQEIPPEYVMATVSSYADARLQAINQRIMSAARLLEVINRFNLYADKRKRFTTEEIISNMRGKDVKFETITADVVNRRTGQPASATIAFSISYFGENPVVVQEVANVLASLYLEENLKVVSQQTEGATKFLQEEMKDVQAKLAELEKRIAAYKDKNPHAVPELLQFNLQALDGTERNYDQVNDRLPSLREKESYLKTQLATIAPDTKNQDKDLLKELRAKLVMLSSKYSDSYPDVKKTKKEIAELEERLNAENTNVSVPEQPDNPAYVALASELASVQSEIESAKRQLEDLDKRRNEYRRRVELFPKVEEGYKNLMVERNSTQAKYDDLMKKFMEAKVAHGLEKEKMGERFTLIDPARLPEKPVRPNRPLILIMGLILGIGAGAGTASLREATDRSARGAEDLATVIPLPILAEIPEIVSAEDALCRRRRLRMAVGITVLLVVGLVLGIHLFVMDMDLLWVRMMKYLNL